MKKTKIEFITAALMSATLAVVPAANTFAAAIPDYAAAQRAVFPTKGPESLEHGVLTTGLKGACVYTGYEDTAKARTSRVLPAHTNWKYSGVVKFTDNTYWYDLGGNQWIKGAEVSPWAAGKASGTVKIQYKPGYSIAVWSSFEAGKLTGKKLKNGTSWRYFGLAVGPNNKTFYNLGGNQWIDAAYVKVTSYK